MANLNAPFGFVPIGTTDGSDYHGKLRAVAIKSSATSNTYVGDFVELTSAGRDAGTTTEESYFPRVAVQAANAVAADKFVGAIVSIDPQFEGESFINRFVPLGATKDILGQIAWGSSVLYAAQSFGSQISADNINSNALLVNNGANDIGNPITGVSGMTLGTVTTPTNAGTFKIHRLHKTLGNEAGEFSIWVVSLNSANNQDENF